jgi:hypothetical protein
MGKTPKYECGICGATGCKLWREYGTMRVYLACAPCAAKAGGRDISTIDALGMREAPEYVWMKGERTDQIGWYVPAIPADDEGSMWGATSTPMEAYERWQMLPTLPKGCKIGT